MVMGNAYRTDFFEIVEKKIDTPKSAIHYIGVFDTHGMGKPLYRHKIKISAEKTQHQ